VISTTSNYKNRLLGLKRKERKKEELKIEVKEKTEKRRENLSTRKMK